MFFSGSETVRINNIIGEASKSIDFLTFVEKEIHKFKISKKRADMIIGEKYYLGMHDILNRKRTVIGPGGEISEVENLPNNRIIDNQYARMVDQKNNYLLAKDFTLDCDDKDYLKSIKSFLDFEFIKIIKNIGTDCFNCGIGWLYMYYDISGKLNFKRFKPYEVIPFWKNSEHSELDCLIRIYEIEGYEGGKEVIFEKAEIYTEEGVKRYIVQNGKLLPDGDGKIIKYNFWQNGENKRGNIQNKIPVVAFRQNGKELPLIVRVKQLQDTLNNIESDFANNMQEDARNTILVIKNYDGTNLGEFRKNLAQYGAVKVKSVDGCDGGISALKIDVDSQNYKLIIDILKRAIVENARGIDSKDSRMMSSDMSRMNIQSVYSDIDLDANSMELEFKAAFQKIFDFLRCFVFGEESEKTDINVIFNRDILINETESIDNCVKSLGILSEKTVISQHPWVSDIETELNRKK